MVIAAAGKSERLGGETLKQFRPLAGVPILLRAVRPFLSHPAVGQVVVALPADAAANPPPWLAELAGERLRLVAGGATRAASVAAGCAVLASESSVVLVHDGARPYPSREVIDAVIAAARGGHPAIAAVPLFDTLKEAEPSAESSSPLTVRRTVSRANLWRAQTPQGFPRDLLERALAAGSTRANPATDEAQLLEEMGVAVVLIRDSVRNLKITTADELRLAEALAPTER